MNGGFSIYKNGRWRGKREFRVGDIDAAVNASTLGRK